MALEKQVIKLDLTGGVDRKDDSFIRLPTRLDYCYNLVFDSNQTLRPREGVTKLDTTARLGSPALGTLLGLHTLRDQLLAEASGGLFSVHDNANISGAVSVDSYIARWGLDVTPVHASPDGAYYDTHDSCILSGLTFVAFADSGNNVYLQTTDAAGNVGALQTIATGGQRVRVIAVNTTTVAVLYHHIASTEIRVRTVTVSAPTTMSAVTSLFNSTDGANIVSTGMFDAASDGAGNVLVGYVDNVTADARACLFNWSSWNSNGDFTSAGTYQAISVAKFSSGQWLVAGGTSPNIDIFVRNSANTATSATSTVALTALWGLYAITDASTGCDLWAYGTNSALTRYTVSTAAVASGTLVSTFVGPASRPFVFGSSTHMLVLFSSQIQRTLFVIDNAGKVNARLLVGLGDYASTARGAAVNVSASGEVTTTVMVRSSATLYSLAKLKVTDMTTTEDAVGPSVQFADAAYMPAALPLLFDGRSLVEVGFNHFPDVITPGATGGGGAIADGTYSYTAHYEWVDASGRIHRSAAAVPVQKVVSGGGGVASVPVAAQSLRITRKSNVRVVFYRTLVNGTTYYRIGSVANNPATTTVSFTDTYADATISSNALIPFTGGVLEPDAAPPARAMCLHQNRIFAAGGTDAYEIAYTQEQVNGTSPLGAEFSDFLRLRVPTKHGRITGLASYQDRLVVICERGFWVFTGSGPDALGNSNGYSDPMDISTPDGMSRANVRSVLAQPDGVWFRGRIGLRLLGPDLQLTKNRFGLPVGSEVDADITARVSGAVFWGAKLQSRFFGSAGLCWVFDHTRGQWSIFAAQSTVTYGVCAGAVLWSDVPTFCSGNEIHKADTSVYTDPSSTPLYTHLRTGWINLASVQGLQRVWRILALGRLHKSTPSGTFQIVVEKDYVSNAGAESSGNRDVTPGGSTDFTGGSTAAEAPFQFRHHVKNQKVQAIQIELFTTQPEIRWSSLTLEVGVKRGAAKLASTRELT